MIKSAESTTQAIDQEGTKPNIVKVQKIKLSEARSMFVCSALDNLRKCVPEPEMLPRSELSPYQEVTVAEPDAEDIIGQHILDIYKRIEELKAEQEAASVTETPINRDDLA